MALAILIGRVLRYIILNQNDIMTTYGNTVSSRFARSNSLGCGGSGDGLNDRWGYVKAHFAGACLFASSLSRSLRFYRRFFAVTSQLTDPGQSRAGAARPINSTLSLNVTNATSTWRKQWKRVLRRQLLYTKTLFWKISLKKLQRPAIKLNL